MYFSRKHMTYSSIFKVLFLSSQKPFRNQDSRLLIRASKMFTVKNLLYSLFSAKRRGYKKYRHSGWKIAKATIRNFSHRLYYRPNYWFYTRRSTLFTKLHLLWHGNYDHTDHSRSCRWFDIILLWYHFWSMWALLNDSFYNRFCTLWYENDEKWWFFWN